MILGILCQTAVLLTNPTRDTVHEVTATGLEPRTT